LATTTSIPSLTVNQIPFVVSVILILLVIYYLVREFRLMKTSNKALELELDKQKLRLIEEDIKNRKNDLGLIMLTPEQFKDIKGIYTDVATLERDTFAMEKLAESKTDRLGLGVKLKKLRNTLWSISKNEEKVFKE